MQVLLAFKVPLLPVEMPLLASGPIAMHDSCSAVLARVALACVKLGMSQIYSQALKEFSVRWTMCWCLAMIKRSMMLYLQQHWTESVMGA